MDNGSDMLMLGSVMAQCADCGGARIFVPVEDDRERRGCEFCCTSCDAAVFLLEVLGSTGTPARRAA